MLDRDIRLTERQIFHLDNLARKRISELGKKIEVADDRRKHGLTVQHGTLDAHHAERGELLAAREQFEGASKYFRNRIMASLGMESS